MLFLALDLVWMLLAAGILILAARRGTPRAWFAALCLGLILFPAVSADDDRRTATVPANFAGSPVNRRQIEKTGAQKALPVDRVWDFLNSILPSNGPDMRRMDVRLAALSSESPRPVCTLPSSPISRGPPAGV